MSSSSDLEMDLYLEMSDATDDESLVSSSKRSFMCPIEGCLSSFKRKAHLERHQRSVHATKHSSKGFSCEICSKVYANTDSLKKHSKIHSKEKISCDECGQIFRQQTSLVIHSYVHTGVKPYSCKFPDCEKRFKTPNKLKVHSTTHDVLRYKCRHENCNQAFSQFKEFRKHMAFDHKKECKICGKTFKEPRFLKSHLLTHEMTRDTISCPYTSCDKFYFGKRSLQWHISTSHSSDFEGFTCDLCGRTLITKQKLREHIEKRHIASHKSPSKSRRSKKPKLKEWKKSKAHQ